MMKYIYTSALFFLVVLSQTIQAQTQRNLLFTDDFTGSSLSSTLWPSSSNASVSDELTLSVSPGRDSGTSYAISEAITLSSVDNILSFSEDLDSSDAYATCYVQVSTNGSTYTDLDSYDIEDIESGETKEISLDDYSGQTIYLRFYLSLDVGTGNTQEWYIDDVAVWGSDIEPPSNFTYTDISSTTVDLSWSLNDSSNPVVITMADSELSDQPYDQLYTSGDTFDDGSELIYVGSDESYQQTDLDTYSTIYFRIWSYYVDDDGDYYYSLDEELSVKALSSDDILYEDFENGNDSDGSYAGEEYTWTMGSGASEWVVGGAEAYEGSSSAYISSDDGSSADYNTSSSADIDLSVTVTIPDSYESAECSFYWKAVGEGGYDGGSVIISYTDDMDRPAETYVIDSKSLYGQETWVEEVVDLTDYIGEEIDIEFNWYNDGMNGTSPGFCVDEVRVTGSDVACPSDFEAEAVSSSEVDLSWVLNENGNDVVVVYSESGTIGSPEQATAYSEGDYLSGGGKVIYVGSDTEYTHSESLEGEVTYAIWSVDTDLYTYSSRLTDEVMIPVSLPYSENFEDGASDWVFDNGGCDDEWVVGSADYKQGSYSAYISNDKGISTSYDALATTYLELEVDLRDYDEVTLSFWYKVEGTSGSAYGSIYIDDVEYTTTSTTGSGRDQQTTTEYYNYYDASLWTEEELDLSDYADDVITLQFRWEDQNQSGDTGFCIDSVYITGTIDDPNSFSATNADDTYNDLTWEQNDYSDDVMIVYSTEDSFGTPEEGTIYEVGDEIDDGGTVLYYGDLEEYTHDPLNYSTTYYYMAYSARNGIYSAGLSANATTIAKDVDLFAEDWEGSSGNIWSTNTDGNNAWVTEGTSTYADGTASAYISDDGSTADYDEGSESEAYLITSAIDLSDETLESATLYFDWKCEGGSYSTGGGPNRITYYDYGEVYISTDGSTYSRVSQQYEYYDNDEWESTSIDLSDYLGSSVYIKFYWYNTGSVDARDAGIGFCVDNIEVTGSVEAQSLLDNANAPTSSISSVANASSDAVDVLEFDITDQTSAYNDATRVKELVISQGSLNTIDDWSDAIGGAYLYGPDIDSDGMEGTISSASITFTDDDEDGLDDGFISVEDATETYYLEVWLNTDLNDNDIADGDAFDFAVSSDDMVTGEGDDFTSGQLVKSGEVSIDVEATAISFTTQPSAYGTVDYALSQVPEVSATDANGNVDLDFEETLALSNSGTLTMSPASATASYGVATFTDLTFSEAGTVTLTADYADSAWTTEESDEVIIASYCIPTHDDDATTCYINNVIINTLSNTTGDDGVYGSYLDESVDLTIGVEYDIDLGVYQSSGTGYAYVWIDWDQSGTFDDDEYTYIGSTTTTGSVEAISGTITVPDGDDAVSGSTRMRVQFAQNSNSPDACDDSNVGETEDYTVVLCTNGWLGSTNQWDVSQNWASGEIPDYSADVYIPEHPYYNDIYPVISDEAAMNDLEIAENASLTISAGSQVDIYGDVTIYGDFIINNTEDEPASLIIEGSVTGNTTVNWNDLTSGQYQLMGHSISDITLSDYSTSYAGGYSLYYYDSGWAAVSSDSDFDTNPMRGYDFKFTTDGEDLSYNGVLNNDDSYTYTADVRAWHLVANPYPVYIDAASDGFDFGDFENTIYIRKGDDVVTTYDLSDPDNPVAVNDGSSILPPNQGIWVWTSTAGSEISISSSAREHQTTAVSLKSSSSVSSNILRFELASDYSTDETVLVFSDYGSESSNNYDADKMLAYGSVANLYSLKDGDDLVINTLPEVESETIVLLGYKVASSGLGEFTITATNVDDFDEDYAVYLVDLDEDEEINLREEPSYTFTPSETQDDDRFEIRLESEAVTTAIDEEEIEVSSSNVVIFSVDQTATVQVSDDVLLGSDRLIEVFNLAGQLISTSELNTTITEIDLPQANMMYIIKVSVDNASYQEKVVSMN
jgi:hypothetical protein